MMNEAKRKRRATLIVASLFGLILLVYASLSPDPNKIDYGEYEALRAGQRG